MECEQLRAFPPPPGEMCSYNGIGCLAVMLFENDLLKFLWTVGSLKRGVTSISSAEGGMADTVPEKSGKLSLHQDWHSIKKIAGIPPECSMRLLPFFRPRSLKKTEDCFSSEWQQASRRLDIAHTHTHPVGSHAVCMSTMKYYYYFI